MKISINLVVKLKFSPILLVLSINFVSHKTKILFEQTLALLRDNRRLNEIRLKFLETDLARGSATPLQKLEIHVEEIKSKKAQNANIIEDTLYLHIDLGVDKLHKYLGIGANVQCFETLKNCIAK